MVERYLNTDQAKRLAVHWARTEPIIRVYIASALGDSHLIDDVVQEVATIVTEKFNEYDEDREFSRWALGIAKHRVAKTIRTKVRDRHIFSSEMISELAGIVAEIQPEIEGRKSALKQCLDALKGRTRRIVEMRYQWSRKIQDIAEELGMNRVAVSGVLLRARKALGDCIERRLREKDQPS